MIAYTTILIIVIVFVLVTYSLYNVYKNDIAKYCVVKLLNSFEFGNLTIINKNNGETVLEKYNDKNDKHITIFVSDERFYLDLFENGEVGLGESYMKKYWMTDDLLGFLMLLIKNKNNKYMSKTLIDINNPDEISDESKIKHHYDVGNDFYQTFLLDDLSAYSCGIWDNITNNLNDAQYNKVNIILKKLNIFGKKSNILDIGCGWGKIANYVANKTNSNVIGLTLSDEQVKYGKDNYNKNVTILKKHYKNLPNDAVYDAIYSIGMFEHVGYENYDIFFSKIKSILKPNCRFLLHTIICTEQSEKNKTEKIFINQHIFPNAQIPNNDWITTSITKSGLSIIHAEFFGGQHYAETLKCWRQNMLSNKKYVIDNYSDELLYKYEYYFSICEAAFRSNIMCVAHYLIENTDNLNLSSNYVCINK